MQGLIGFPISPWNVFTRINEDFFILRLSIYLVHNICHRRSQGSA